MLLILFVTILGVQADSFQNYDPLFDIFNALYFSAGLQFNTGDPNMPVAWIEGNLQLIPPVPCNKSPNGLRKDCHVFFKTGIIILRNHPNVKNTYFKLNGCYVAMIISEFEAENKFNVSISSSNITNCDSAVEVKDGKETPITVQLKYLTKLLTGKAKLFHFQYDKYIDSYPVQPIKDETMRQLFGYVMHSGWN
nr:uncharacterized protein LOC112211325 [Halyomorpha halys]